MKKYALPPSSSESKPLIENIDKEKWKVADGTMDSQADEVFNSVLLIIPFSSLLLLMEILIRHQYGKTASLDVILDRMVPGVPILSIFIFFTTRYKTYRKMQAFLFLMLVLAGSRMIYILNHASWLVNMKQCPPLATIWIYTVIQLDLGAAVVGLLTVGAFVWWKDLKILQL